MIIKHSYLSYIYATLIFLFTFVCYSLNLYSDFRSGDYRRLLPAGDVVPNTFLPLLILKEKTFRFDEYVQELRRFNNWSKDPVFLVKRKGNYYSAYPPFTGIAAIPFYIIPVIFEKIPNIGNLYYLMKVLFIGRITASLISAASAGFVFLTLVNMSKPVDAIRRNTYLGYAVVGTILYALGTTTFSISSRGLWQHTVSEFFIALITLLLVASTSRSTWVPIIGFLCGLAVLARPTNIILVLFVSAYVLFNHKNKFLKFLIFSLPCVVFMCVYNYAVFGSPFVEGYGARQDFNWSTSMYEGLLGFLFSPARSFLFVSPPLVLGYYGIWKLFRDKHFGGIYNVVLKYLSMGFISSMLMFSKWYTWHGGNGFGYRMLTDYLPILGVLTFLGFIYIIKKYENMRIYVRIIHLFLGILIMYSIYVQTNAVLNLYSKCSSSHNWDFYCLAPKFN